MPLDVREEYVRLMDLLVRLVESRKGEQVPPERGWEVDMQPLAGKLFHHLGTMFCLWEKGTTLPPLAGVTPGYVDSMSVAVVCRAAFESFLAFHHIFAEAESAARKRFRHKMWTVGGLRSRQGYLVVEPENKLKMRAEADQIKQLVDEIEGDPLFQALTPAQRKLAVKGEWRLGLPWHELASRAGFVEEYFRYVYRFLCGRAHSDYLSVIQFRDATTLDTQRRLAAVYLQFGLVLMGYFARTYAALAPKAADVLNRSPDAAMRAQMWYEVGREIAAARQKAAETD